MCTPRIYQFLDTFDPNEDSWIDHLCRLEGFFAAHSIQQESDRRSILLSSLTRNGRELLCQLLGDQRCEKYPYSHIVKLLYTDYRKNFTTFANRDIFYCACKYPEESLYQWGLRVKHLARLCKFGSEYENAIKDKFVIGLDDGDIKQRLYKEDVKITFAKAYGLAVNTEKQLKLMEYDLGDTVPILTSEPLKIPPPRPIAPKPKIRILAGDQSTSRAHIYEEIDLKQDRKNKSKAKSSNTTENEKNEIEKTKKSRKTTEVDNIETHHSRTDIEVTDGSFKLSKSLRATQKIESLKVKESISETKRSKSRKEKSSTESTTMNDWNKSLAEPNTSDTQYVSSVLPRSDPIEIPKKSAANLQSNSQDAAIVGNPKKDISFLKSFRLSNCTLNSLASKFFPFLDSNKNEKKSVSTFESFTDASPSPRYLTDKNAYILFTHDTVPITPTVTEIEQVNSSDTNTTSTDEFRQNMYFRDTMVESINSKSDEEQAELAETDDIQGKSSKESTPNEAIMYTEVKGQKNYFRYLRTFRKREQVGNKRSLSDSNLILYEITNNKTYEEDNQNIDTKKPKTIKSPPIPVSSPAAANQPSTSGIPALNLSTVACQSSTSIATPLPISPLAYQPCTGSITSLTFPTVAYRQSTSFLTPLPFPPVAHQSSSRSRVTSLTFPTVACQTSTSIVASLPFSSLACNPSTSGGIVNNQCYQEIPYSNNNFQYVGIEENGNNDKFLYKSDGFANYSLTLRRKSEDEDDNNDES